MRGRHFWGAGVGFGVVGNLWCHFTGRPTLSSELRLLPWPVVAGAMAGFAAWFLRHLYRRK